MALGLSATLDGEATRMQSQGLALVASYQVQDAEWIVVFAQRNSAGHVVVDSRVTYAHEKEDKLQRCYLGSAEYGDRLSISSSPCTAEIASTAYLQWFHQCNLGFFKVVRALSCDARGKAWSVTCDDIATHTVSFHHPDLAAYVVKVSLGTHHSDGCEGIKIQVVSEVGAASICLDHDFAEVLCVMTDQACIHYADVILGVVQDIGTQMKTHVTLHIPTTTYAWHDTSKMSMHHLIMQNIFKWADTEDVRGTAWQIKQCRFGDEMGLVFEIAGQCCVQIDVMKADTGDLLVSMHLRQYGVLSEEEAALHVALYPGIGFSVDTLESLQVFIPCIKAFMSRVADFVHAMKAKNIDLTTLNEDLLAKLFNMWFMSHHPGQTIAGMVKSEATPLHVEVSTEVHDLALNDERYVEAGFQGWYVFTIGNEVVVIYATQGVDGKCQVDLKLTYLHIWESGSAPFFLTSHTDGSHHDILDRGQCHGALPDGVNLVERHQRNSDFLHFAEALFEHCAREGWEVELEDLAAHQISIRFYDSWDDISEQSCLSISFGTASCVQGTPHELTLLRDDGAEDNVIQTLKMTFSAHDTVAARKALMDKLIKLIKDWQEYGRNLGDEDIPVSSLPCNFMGSNAWKTFFYLEYGQDYMPEFYGLVNDTTIPPPSLREADVPVVGVMQPQAALPVAQAGQSAARPAGSSVLPTLGSGAFQSWARGRDDEVSNQLMAEDGVGPRSTRRRRTGSSLSA